jgi:hypothetical protein
MSPTVPAPYAVTMLGCDSFEAASISRSNRRATLLTPLEFLPDHLQDFDPLGALVPHLVDQAHPALAQLFQDAIVPDRQRFDLALVDMIGLVARQPARRTRSSINSCVERYAPTCSLNSAD